ncbi:protein-methionine-sulfoxide reductase heme-binding subunit MsrQ [Pseudooceanicola nitratireducens]|uniref:protein-methionine-sulfoxide reductase heme-binding subunit MsrQ n=1 Tax=Pseudooceanicola nitratireducens TaxID=517719 RepID=UPI003C7CBEEB
MSDSTSATPGLRDRLTLAINQGARRVPTWVLYIVGAVPPVWLFIAGLTGGLGVDPVKAMEHQMGEWALWLLIAGLCITPLRRFAGINLLRFRRAIGLLAFFYIVGHLLVWLVLDVQILSQIWRDILKRPYITIGMGAFVLLIPLAVTSNNFSIRKMGARWRQLHKLVYLAAVLGAVHFVMLVKGFQYEPLIYLGVVLALLALRLPILSRRR